MAEFLRRMSAACGGTRREGEHDSLDTEPPHKIPAAEKGEGDTGEKVARPDSSGVECSGGDWSTSSSSSSAGARSRVKG